MSIVQNRRRQPIRLRSALAAVPLLLALALTGCGSDDGGGVASAGGDKTPTSKSTSTLSNEERALKFAQCMREHGVDMEDPEPGKANRVEFKGNGKDREKVEKAMRACREFSPQANSTGGTNKKAEEAARKFAECMRENGVEDFPDPKPGQRGIKIDKKQADDPDFDKAQEKCRDELPGGKKTGGQ